MKPIKVPKKTRDKVDELFADVSAYHESIKILSKASLKQRKRGWAILYEEMNINTEESWIYDNETGLLEKDETS